MSEDRHPLLVFSTVGDAESARRLADVAVGAGLAACVNILPPVTSVFRWEPGDGGDPGRDSSGSGDAAGPDPARAAVQAEDEVLLLIKTSAEAYPALEARLRAEHPYDLPEIIAVPITHGLPAFIRWIDETARC